tara:strand:+ start:267 stop:476 length:210 start_codon:yes stop_codon:yes gene_type:complete
MNFVELIYFFCFSLLAGTAFAFMYKSMDLVFKDLDKPKRTIHPEIKDIKEGDELLVFRVKEDKTDLDLH